MCIFSQSIRQLSDTSIFARLENDRQFLVYEMRLASDGDLAMILPLPTDSANEHSAAFINLLRYPEFFDDMRECFPQPVSRSQTLAVAAGPGTLLVQRVGAFDASFVPSRSDFARLDPRFRLGEGVWSALPRYDDYGFAVFQLRAGEGRIHPMALSFRTRNPKALYYPTTHVHNGHVSPTADFDHSLYAQGIGDSQEWRVSSLLPRAVMRFSGALVADHTRGTVKPDVALARRILRGQLENTDTWQPADAS